MIRLYIASAIVAALGLAYWRYDYVVNQNKQLKTQLESIGGILERERLNAQESANMALARQIEANKNDQELEKLRDCIADKSCVPRVRVKSACPMPGTTTSATGANATSPGFAEIDGQDYYRLIEAQKKALWMIKGLQAEVAARSHPDFCQPK